MIKKQCLLLNTLLNTTLYRLYHRLQFASGPLVFQGSDDGSWNWWWGWDVFGYWHETVFVGGVINPVDYVVGSGVGEETSGVDGFILGSGTFQFTLFLGQDTVFGFVQVVVTVWVDVFYFTDDGVVPVVVETVGVSVTAGVGSTT